ncbi:MAG: hypothetical protein NTY02_13145, partial [Acidobacteria bacterium]|nr:hypothetical protein [Acidobacteriota bacterium]
MPRRRDVGRSAGRWALCARAMLIAVIGAGLAAAVPAAAEEQPTYRLFLLDDTPLVSYSEITHVGGRAVFTVPLGSASDPAALRVVSLPERLVDWERTNRYSDAVRLRRYATTRGDDDYKALTEFLARAMSDMAFSTDPAEKLRIGGDARRKLAEWPAAHFGFRELEVRELTAILEEAISDVQASAG